MREKKLVIISLVFTSFFCVNLGCNINDHQLWTIPIQATILDTYEGTVISRGTTDIEGINSTRYGQATLAGPYFDISIVDSQLIVQTNSAFRSYEEVEVASRVAITVEFNCVGGSTRGGLILWIDITDTNNNAPQFMLTADEYEFVITPPLPPGYSITGCYNDIITVRDIDLTTQRIDFSLDDSTYFEIFYDEAGSTTNKEFNAQIRTTTFIRSLNETLILRITATDVDLTSDPALSTTIVLRIKADSEFQFPEELVFSQTFYLANYTDDHQLILLETISLRQGFDEYVNFTLEGEYLEYFDLDRNGNEVTLIVSNPIPVNVWSERQILFIIKAEREYTSGSSATIIVQLYEGTELQFERVFYEGYIEDNNLQLSPLILSQGFDGTTVTAVVIGDFSSYFTALVQQNLVTLTMDPLISEVIEENRVISLPVLATSDHSSTYTVVNLDIIKDDNVTPVFDQTIYSGCYDPVTGLSVEQIEFVQGFDDTVTVDLLGEHANLFQIVRNGAVLTLTSSGIPSEMFSLQNILISIEASKPRTVGANAAIHIVLPAARELEFEEPTYWGSIEDDVLSLRTILLTQGYEDGVSFNISGDYSAYFTVSSVLGEVTVLLTRSLPDSVITENSVIILTLIAYSMNAISTRTNILLNIIKNDTTTPVFSQLVYYGTYFGTEIEIEAINLGQGFDDSISFRLDGAHAQYFEVNNLQNNVVISLQSPIPEDVIFSEKVLLFNVLADKAFTVSANAAVLIKFPTELTDLAILKFSRNSYIGSLENNEIQVENIVLESGFANGTDFNIFGDYAEHFSLTSTDNVVQISSLNTLPDSILENNHFIVLEIEATRVRAATVWTSVVLDIVKEEIIAPVFGQAYYTGLYTETSGLTFEETINLTEGYDETVTFALSGESSAWFDIEKDGDSVFLVLRYPVPSEVVTSNSHIIFTIVANKPNKDSGIAVIFIDLPKEFSDNLLRFEQSVYKGIHENDSITLDEIILEGYTSEVNYTLTGDYVVYFHLTNQNGIFTINLETTLPNEVIEETNIFVFTLEAQNVNIRTHTAIVLENVSTIQESSLIEFEQPYYVGLYSTSEGLQFNSEIRLTNEPNANPSFNLEGEDAQWFGLVQNNDHYVSLTLTSSIPASVLANNYQLVFIVTAQIPDSATARTTVVISLPDSIPEGSTILGFDQVNYVGSIENNQSNIPPITLRDGYSEDVEFTLRGELSEYFGLERQEAVVEVVLQNAIPEQTIPANGIIMLIIQATAPQAVTAYATIVVECVVENNVSPFVELVFAQTFYNGSYAMATGLNFPTPISLTQGYDSNVVFSLEGDNAQWFNLEREENSVSVTLTSPIPASLLASNQQLVFVVTAQSPNSATARATIIIYLSDYSQPGSDVTFEKVLYEGVIQNSVVNHETITLVGFSGSAVDLRGDYSSQFESDLSNGEVIVSVSGPLTLPENVTHVALELHAGTASSVLLLNVPNTGPSTPTVTFSSSSYGFQVDKSQTGQVGQVHATANNGEAVTYSLLLDSALLQESLTVNAGGELYLAAPLNNGLFNFQVVATTVSTQIQGFATVHLSVEAINLCPDENAMNPLIILDVDEEEPHYDLLNGTQYGNCHFILTNRWPVDHTWVYVDENGLHTTAIDREHEYIAFMPLSQVQVEVNLHCEGDPTRIKRSLNSDALGPYDYGSNKWILTDTIFFNSRRSFVNIIINDINDNAPIFAGKENEPIAVGYPVPELAEIILPRSLVELKATDADIGENAALLYWSSAPELAVAATTGFVHLRDVATLENGSRYTVSATDRNGQGLTGSIDILVRLLDENHIAVVTIRDAFLDDEGTVISSLSEGVGYEVKVLRSAVISDGGTDVSRIKRDVSRTGGASLQLYVYGLIAREPVSVEQLTADISNIVTAPVIIASSVSLQDHLEGQEICVIAGRDTGLLVATIVLSVFLFIVLVLIAVWFFLRWRKNRNYDEFSDVNSLSSRNVSDDNVPKPEAAPKPRLDYAELKKSERRLQEMLDAPIENVIIEPSIDSINDAILNMPEPMTPIVIQSIDKLKDPSDDSGDEYGEVDLPRRKSVVTFNENVEKIIHLEDTPDAEDLDDEPEFEIYKL